MRRRRQVQAEQQEDRFAADIERRRAWREEQLQAQQQEDEARAVRRHSCWRRIQASCFPILLRRPLVWQTGGVIGALTTAVRVSLACGVGCALLDGGGGVGVRGSRQRSSTRRVRPVRGVGVYHDKKSI
jgi:hypothetical protein